MVFKGGSTGAFNSLSIGKLKSSGTFRVEQASTVNPYGGDMLVSLGFEEGASGVLEISGSGSSVHAGDIDIGLRTEIFGESSIGVGTVSVKEGASLDADGTVTVGNGGRGTLIAEGDGTSVDTGPLVIGSGEFGEGDLWVNNAAVLTSTESTIALEDGAGKADILMGSAWNIAGQLRVQKGGRINIDLSDVTSAIGSVQGGADIVNGELPRSVQIFSGTWRTTDADAGFDIQKVYPGPMEIYLDHGTIHAAGHIYKGLGVDVKGNGAQSMVSDGGSVHSAGVGADFIPGTDEEVIGHLTIDGDFDASQGTTYRAELEMSGISDLIDVSGTATLAGEVHVTAIVPSTGYAAGESFTILTASSISGEFDNLVEGVHWGAGILPVLADGLAWRVEYSDTALTLTVVKPYDVKIGAMRHGVAGDTNVGSGSVDWRRVYSTSKEGAIAQALDDTDTILSDSRSNGDNLATYGPDGSSSNRLSLRSPEETGRRIAGSEAPLSEVYSDAGDYAIAYEDGVDWDYNDSYFPVWVVDALATAGHAPWSAGQTAQLDFDETSGTTATDSSGGGNSAALYNGAGFAASGQPDGGNALALDGVDDYAQVADADNLDGTSKLTLSFWVNPSLLDGQARGIISKRISSTSNISYSVFFYTGTPGIPHSSPERSTTCAFIKRR